MYLQKGAIVENLRVHVSGVDPSTNSIAIQSCDTIKNVFVQYAHYLKPRGMHPVDQALTEGMVLVFLYLGGLSCWRKSCGACGVSRGACPTELETPYPGASVVFSNIRVGPIGSTLVPSETVAWPAVTSSYR